MPERFFRTWEADRPRAVVALVHGIAEHTGRYEHVGARLAGAGYTTVAVDLLGHGRSAGWPGEVGGLADWHADLDALLERGRASADGLPVFLLGHSLGALVVASYVIAHPDAADGLLLSGTAVLAGEAYLLASAAGEGVPPETISRDPEVVRAYVEDPLVFEDQVGPELNSFALEAAIETNTRAGEITLPVILVHGGGDRIADPEGVRDLHQAIGSADKTIRIYDGLYHEVLNEPEQEEVLADLVAWLDAHTGG